MRRLALILALVPALALPACGKSDKTTAPRAPSWMKVTVDAAGTVGLHSSLALDAHGDPCIAYCDFNGPLKCADRNGAAWAVEVADPLAGAFPAQGAAFASLALDAAGSPRISYWDQRTWDLVLVARNGALWAREVLDAGGNVGAFSALALDADGHPHISYHRAQDATHGELKYLTWTGTSYLIETVEAAGLYVGYYTSIALDAQGNPHISYFGNGDLKYAVRRGGTWTVETVDDGSMTTQRTSLALDAAGNPRISYQGATLGRLKYASRSGGSWTLETVDASANSGYYSSLALDAQGEPRIAYDSQGDLKYAVRSGGTWTVETVDDGKGGAAEHRVGDYASLKLDSRGNPHIAYYDATTYDLKFAEWGIH